ncbi:uncharacterized protein PHALS_15098 [Plasmopara halstedii]|uniref:Uncharacterized protein n=1 Tax=Plasmopara halstedii TaxID=4781 RepID=A0A0P1B1S1_PLAHL|nr:uncharacterized protein PHALS_15098 [Plasmopara halstedii]CEG48050.1 hypothetical protein PHALS_15098 [Plasmopara halstedii]|eukprot:XP_024584419.1 hypothetical protein PHALS_15098 [Plasmopara halstedii]
MVALESARAAALDPSSSLIYGAGPYTSFGCHHHSPLVCLVVTFMTLTMEIFDVMARWRLKRNCIIFILKLVASLVRGR